MLGAGTSRVPNPAGRGRTHGGGDFGAAAAVAGGLADLALAVDELGSARVPAACCGAYALRATAGALPLEGAAVASPSLAAPALLAADPSLLLKAGQALRLPGGEGAAAGS
jgi:amidase